MTDNEQIGCSDGYCDITGKATGMHTNGGCKCLHGMDPDKRRVVRGELKRLRECERLATRHEEMRRQAEATCGRRTTERDALAAELLDEQGAHAKTADNFEVFACSISDGDDATGGPS